VTIVACLLAVGIVCVYFAHARQMTQLEDAHAQERAKLLDRIQFPQVRQVDAGEVVERDPPTDAGELAQVGQIVPDYVNVGQG
jgi:hypothetical protein